MSQIDEEERIGDIFSRNIEGGGGLIGIYTIVYMGGDGGYVVMVWEVSGGRQIFDEEPDGQDWGYGEDQNQVEGDILLPGGDNIVPSGCVIKARGQVIINKKVQSEGYWGKSEVRREG